jgi:hypothetical protein
MSFILQWVVGGRGWVLFDYGSFLKKRVLGCVCFPESDFRETTFQTFMCLFAIKKDG